MIKTLQIVKKESELQFDGSVQVSAQDFPFTDRALYVKIRNKTFLARVVANMTPGHVALGRFQREFLNLVVSEMVNVAEDASFHSSQSGYQEVHLHKIRSESLRQRVSQPSEEYHIRFLRNQFIHSPLHVGQIVATNHIRSGTVTLFRVGHIEEPGSFVTNDTIIRIDATATPIQ